MRMEQKGNTQTHWLIQHPRKQPGLRCLLMVVLSIQFPERGTQHHLGSILPKNKK